MPNRPIRAQGLSEPNSHYTDAVVAGPGRTSYISNQGASDKTGELVGRGDITAQTRKTLDNMKIALAAAGATLADVVKVTVYLGNVEDRQKVNEVRRSTSGRRSRRARSFRPAGLRSRGC
jgi:enamine deaminase RidA (YjgF/YER057c/UK114 family)